MMLLSAWPVPVVCTAAAERENPAKMALWATVFLWLPQKSLSAQLIALLAVTKLTRERVISACTCTSLFRLNSDIS